MWRDVRDRWFWGILLVAVVAVFGQVAGFEFLGWDDPAYVTGNPRVLAGLSWAGIRWAFETKYYGLWYPLTWVTHMTDVSLWGTWAGGHHLTSVAIHVAATGFLYAFLREAGIGWGRSMLIALLFCLHPLRAESVAWIAERKDVLCIAALMAMLWSYGRWVRSNRWTYAVLAHLACLLAVMSKPLAVVAPALLLLVDYWPLARGQTLLRLVTEKIGYGALAAIVLAVIFTGDGQPVVLGGGGRDQFDLATRIWLSGNTAWMLVFQTFWPVGLSFYHPIDWNTLTFKGVWGLLFVGMLLGLVLWQWRRRPWVAVGLLWYGLTLAPSSGIIQISGYAFADRYAYLPSVGLWCALILFIPEWTGGSSRWRDLRPVAFLLVILLPLSFWQVSHWKNSEALFLRATVVDPGNAFAHLKLSDLYFHAKRYEEAERHALQAANPAEGEWYQFQLKRHLGQIAFQRGNYTAARAYWNDAMRLRPGNPTIHYHFGLLAIAENNWPAAIEYLGAAVAQLPDNWIIWAKLGRALGLQGDLPRAREAFQTALRINPNDKDTLFDYAGLLERLGAHGEAEVVAQRARQIEALQQEK